MQIALPFLEAIALATSRSPLPPVVTSLTCDGSTVHVELDLRQIESPSLAVRLALAAGGTVRVDARIDWFENGIATLVVTVHARGLPAHKLLPYLVGPIEDALRARGLPEKLVTVQRSDSDTEVLIELQQAVDSRTDGLVITSLRVDDAVIHLSAAVGEFRVR